MNLRRTLIDTHFVVALNNRKDRHHDEAVELAALYEGEPTVVTHAVLLEIGNSLASGLKQEAVRVIDSFLASADVEVVPTTPELFDRAFSLYRSRLDKDWGLVDCISFVVMQERGMTDALTFDQHFVQAGFRALMRPSG